MSFEIDFPRLKTAFQDRPDLQAAIQAAATTPAYIELFNQISLYVCNLAPPPSLDSEPASKKRRLDGGGAVPDRSVANGTNANGQQGRPNGSGSGSAPASAASVDDPVLLEVKDISVVIPQRKKYTLCFTSTHLYARLPDAKEPVPGTSFAWKDIEYIFCLPVPEKAQKQYNYILFPTSSTIPPSKPTPGKPPTPEPLVFTIPDTAPKPGTVSGTDAAKAASVAADDYRSLFDWAILERLRAAGKPQLKIERADERLFHSVQRQSHRGPDEKAVHVRAFRGSKDGYLFFLPSGILWAFKKPLLFLPHERIGAVSYTSVLQRTFNLSVEVETGAAADEDGDEEDGEGKQEFEFSMLDQEDFAGIDAFVKRHGLQDGSMAEQRRAKRENVNVVKDEHGNVVGHAEAGELERATQEAVGEVDEEDEEEEDYDPGSEGESEGSGSSSEEEGEGEEDTGFAADEGDEDEEEEEGEEVGLTGYAAAEDDE